MILQQCLLFSLLAIPSVHTKRVTESFVIEHDKSSVVLVYPGSFSPVQLSHIRAAQIGKKALEEASFQVHSVRLSAVNDGYNKKGLWPAKTRLKLGKMAVQELGAVGIVVDPWEAQQDAYVPTPNVMAHFSKTFKATGKVDKVMMLGGADLYQGMFLNEPTPSIPWTWPAEDVLELLTQLDGIVIIQRSGAEMWGTDTIREHLKEKLQDGGVEDIQFLDAMTIIIARDSAGDGSSTKVRKLIGGGLDTKEQQDELARQCGEAEKNEIVAHLSYYKRLVRGVKPSSRATSKVSSD